MTNVSFIGRKKENIKEGGFGAVGNPPIPTTREIVERKENKEMDADLETR